MLTIEDLAHDHDHIALSLHTEYRQARESWNIVAVTDNAIDETVTYQVKKLHSHSPVLIPSMRSLS